MNPRHPKTVRRQILTLLYNRYLDNPLEMLTPGDIMADGLIEKGDLIPNIHYLSDRGLVELMTGYNPPLFAAARITADGIDLVEDRFHFNLRFPPQLGQEEETHAELPRLIEQLFDEAEFAPLDGEARKALLRDVEFLRDEVARPVPRWRRPVIETVLEWIAGHARQGDEPLEEMLPSLQPVLEVLRRPEE